MFLASDSLLLLPPPRLKMARTGTHGGIGQFDPLLNITDNNVLIHKLRQDKSGQALRCLGERSADSEAPDVMFISSVVDYCIHAYIEGVRYIFIAKISFCVLMVQVADSCRVVKIKNDNFYKTWKFFISVRVTSITIIG